MPENTKKMGGLFQKKKKKKQVNTKFKMLKKSGSHASPFSWQQDFEWQAMGRLVPSYWLPLHVCILMSVCVLEGPAAWQRGERSRQTTEEEERSTAGRTSVGAQIPTLRNGETVKSFNI